MTTLGSTGAAFAVTLLLGLEERPFLFPMLAVVISAIHGGLWAGIASGAITIALVNYVVIQPAGRLSLPASTDLWQLAVFGGVASAISFLTNRRRDAEDRLRAQARVLETMIGERDALLRREHAGRADAEQASRHKDEFLATLSHELKTPLNAVIGWLQVLTRRDVDPAQQRRALDVIYRNSLAQARLVEDVLDLSRVVAGRLAVAQERVDLADVVRQAADSHMPAAAHKQQALTVAATTPVIVVGDAGRLRQIAWNLLSNATKFTDEGGTIQVSVIATDSQAVLTVADNGCGIDPDFLPHAFDAFRQQDGSTTRVHGGLGIGLSLVERLVKAHGGRAEARSAGAGTGTTIEVRLPLASIDASRDTIE